MRKRWTKAGRGVTVSAGEWSAYGCARRRSRILHAAATLPAFLYWAMVRATHRRNGDAAVRLVDTECPMPARSRDRAGLGRGGHKKMFGRSGFPVRGRGVAAIGGISA
jgi:hypothetical protein